MSLARVFCSWSIAAVLLLLSIHFSSSEKSLDPVVSSDENGEEGNGTPNVTLTGNPQIDYVHDPNLPRELNGHNLSDYPFYSRVPKNINFSCDGRKEGFYASVEHKCQIYHHCLFGSRFDFLCANYTAFDQRTFICQFVSDVDCPNSHMYFHRNNDLYVTKSTTAAPPINIDRDFYARRPPKRPKTRPRLTPVEDYSNDNGADKQAQTQESGPGTAVPTAVEENSGPAPPAKKKQKDTEYADDDDYYEDDWDYPRRPARRRRRKCRNGRRRGRRCRPRRPAYYDDDYEEDDYDYAYYDDARPRKGGKRRRPQNAIPAGTSQVTLTSSSETPAPTSTTTTTTTTEPPPLTSSEVPVTTTTLSEFDTVAAAEKTRGELLTKTRRPFSNFRNNGLRPSRQNDKNRFGGTTSTSTTTTTSTTTERAKPSTTKATTTTTEVPQYIYDYEYYEDDTMVDQQDSISSSTTTTTTPKPSLRGKLRGGNSAAALIEKQRVQQSIQVRVTEDSETSTNTIRRRDNSNVQTPTRVATPPPSTTSKTTTTVSTSPVSRPARFWQRKSTVKSISTTKTPSTTTTTTLAPYYQEYQDEDYEDEVPQPTAPAQPALPPPPPPKQSNRFQAIVNTPQHQYGTSPAAALRQTSYVNAAPSASPHIQQSVTSSTRGGGQGSSLTSSSYAQPSSQSQLRSNKQQHYAMQQQPQQYSQSSSSSSSISSNGNSNSNRDTSSNYNTNSYHRQRVTPPQPVPKPEFISLVDEDYNNPYVSGPSGPAVQQSTSPSSTRLYGGGGRGSSASGALALGNPGYHQQHPIRFFEQHQAPAFLFGAASEYNNPQFAFPPRNYPSPSNFQPYGQSTRRFAPHHMYK